ncbi:unnamed protein product [Hyaloperonospora brassicae]|uniref:Golgin-84 n=1 Tax=Hyaloperonospora brassicae TaxID=162125 RepID=A0AAV0UBM4_HYABA|nr:unnamed protein product [Hyaloperonospora brassicae]
MNWVSSSLELAGSLLESVDEQAALTLAGKEGEEDGAQEQSKRMLPTMRTSQTSAVNALSMKDNTGESMPKESPVMMERASDRSSLSCTNAQAKNHTNVAPPSHSMSGKKSAEVERTMSSQLENVSSGTGGDTPLSNGSRQTSSLDGEVDRLHKELNQAKKELRVKEKQLSSTQKSMKICEKELVALEEECRNKVTHVQHELSAIQQGKTLNEQEFVRALERKDNQVRSMKAEIDALSKANAKCTGDIDLLKAELATAVQSKDTLWTSAASASNESEQLIQSLRIELQDTLTAMHALKREHIESKNTMYSRQSKLETVNAELLNNVASLERELAKARETASVGSQTRSADDATTVSSSASIGTNSMNDDYRRVQRKSIVTKKLLHDESKKNEMQKQEIITLTGEVHRLEQAIKNTEERSARQLAAVSTENEELKEQVKRLTSQDNATTAASDELRIQRLTKRLIEKQETIDSLRSRVTTMDVRLQHMQLQAQQAEEKFARVVQHGGIDDMEMATSVGKTGRSDMRLRPNRMANMISRVVPVVGRSHHVWTALDVLDSWLLFLGRVFLQAAFARLAMMCYIVLIHLWVFTIISFHTSHLTEETQLASAAEYGAVEREEDLMPGGGH